MLRGAAEEVEMRNFGIWLALGFLTLTGWGAFLKSQQLQSTAPEQGQMTITQDGTPGPPPRR
jgi:hypothetical protein